MDPLNAVLKYLGAFKPDVAIADLAPLAGCYNTEKFQSGEIVFAEGDRYRKIAFVVSGLLKKYYLTPDGKKFIKEFTWEGQVTTPYASILQNGEATYTLEALEETVLLTLDYSVIEDLTRRDPKWLAIAKALADHHFLNREKREMELLRLSAVERHAAFKKRFAHLLGRLKKQEIAGYLGITPESLSRLEAQSRRR